MLRHQHGWRLIEGGLNGLFVMVRQYPLEAGVRQLERTVGNIARKVAFKVALGEKGPNFI